MNRSLLSWAPRILLILFALFLALFSLDVFEDGMGAGALAVDLLVHNLPSLLLLGVLAVAWRRPAFGAFACAALGLFYLAWAWGAFPLSTYLVIAGPLFACAALFLLDWRSRRAVAA